MAPQAIFENYSNSKLIVQIYQVQISVEPSSSGSPVKVPPPSAFMRFDDYLINTLYLYEYELII